MKTLASYALLTLIPVTAQAQDGSRVRTAMLDGRALPYQVIDGLAVYAGDIILGTAEEVATWNGNGGGRANGWLSGRNLAKDIPPGFRESTVRGAQGSPGQPTNQLVAVALALRGRRCQQE